SPQRTGRLWPIPGTSMRQLSSLSVQLAGIVVASDSPLPLGPRKRVHSWVVAVEDNAAIRQADNDKQSAKDRMGKPRTKAGRLGRDRTYVLIVPDRNN